MASGWLIGNLGTAIKSISKSLLGKTYEVIILISLLHRMIFFDNTASQAQQKKYREQANALSFSVSQPQRRIHDSL